MTAYTCEVDCGARALFPGDVFMVNIAASSPLLAAQIAVEEAFKVGKINIDDHCWTVRVENKLITVRIPAIPQFRADLDYVVI
jgi:hypothetical protein